MKKQKDLLEILKSCTEEIKKCNSKMASTVSENQDKTYDLALEEIDNLNTKIKWYKDFSHILNNQVILTLQTLGLVVKSICDNNISNIDNILTDFEQKYIQLQKQKLQLLSKKEHKND